MVMVRACIVPLLFEPIKEITVEHEESLKLHLKASSEDQEYKKKSNYIIAIR